MAAQPDGRALLACGKLNIVLGCLLALWLIFAAPSSYFSGVDVVFLLGLPLVGFVWFLKDMPSPQLTPLFIGPTQKTAQTGEFRN